MSRHQAYRNYDYQNDIEEFDGGDNSGGEEELSPEDQALMTASTAQVREALGVAAAQVTTTQIQEALWHYYYDVEKSVTYLVTKFIAPAPPKPAKSAQKRSNGQGVGLPCQPPSETERRLTWIGQFRDLPWGNIPEGRRAVLVPPDIPKWGLLGGSGAPPKMSKLQALAAARKKKVEEKKGGAKAPKILEKAGDSQTGDEKKTEDMVQHAQVTLGDLRIGEKPLLEKENERDLAARASKRLKRFTAETTAPQAPATETLAKSQSYRLRLDGMGKEVEQLPNTDGTRESEEDLEVEPAQPSAFAQTLFGTASTAPRDPPTARPFAVPYTAFSSSIANAFSVPSPDDVVLAAQSKAGKKSGSTAAQKARSDATTEGVTSDLKTLKVDDAPLPKSKNLNVVSEFERTKTKKSASFVVVGHVDAGKSTLMGRLLLDLNVVDQRTVERYRKEAERIGKSSFHLAWILDQRPEERARGVTIDVATNKFETETTSFTILDAPGHRDFIPNMIAGASQADFAILVIDASTGSFEAGLKGQTREHSLLLRSMGVSRVIVAVNKLDTVDWSRERFDEISQQVSGFLSATGFQAKNISFIPVSGLYGDNLARRSDAPAASWYTGPILIDELENSEPTARALHKPLRMTISEVFRTTQSPVTISGRIDAGSVQTGDALLIQPSGEKAYVKSLELDQEAVDWAVAGQNAVIHLANIDAVHVRVGDIACDPARPVACVDSFALKALAFDILMPMQVDVHRGRLHAAGQISELVGLLDKVSGAVTKRRPKIIKPGSVARIAVKMSTKVPLEKGQRVVLRSGGETVAAGLLE